MAIQDETASNTIELGDHMERHIVEAFRVASALASKGEISAADLLRAAIIVIRKDPTPSSQAFSRLESLLPLDNVPNVSTIDPIPEIRLSPELAKHYGVAQKYFSDATRVWGRDYVTFAILTDSDPSLNEIANEANTMVDQLQDAWFEFVTSDSQHRDRNEWEGWWEEAGVPVPEERTNVAGSTYLLTWNPDRFPEGEIEDTVNKIASSGSTLMRWSTGSRRHVSRGERVFLLRQGMEPRGLVGSGRIEGEVEQIQHWDSEKRERGERTWVVPVLWDKLSTTPIISLEELIQETGEERLWKTRAGGVKIRPALARELEELWRQAESGSVVTEAFRYAQTLSDLDHKNDWIGIRADVEALSTLVAVNRVEPPLSIAIFGDWGSGKTFLMRKLQERVQLLESIGKTQEEEAAAGTEVTRYCSSILQIEFNAWHYTESNLWASLVNHIFEKLHAKLTPEDSDKQHADAVETLFQKLGLARAAREVAENQVQLIAAEVSRAADTVKEEETRVQTASAELATAVGRSVWDNLGKVLDQEDEKPQGLCDALKHFGIEEPLTSAQTVYDTVEQFRSVSGRAREVFGSLLATKQGVYGAIVVALVVFLATIIATIYKVPILTIGTALAGILGWLAERAGSARKALSAIKAFDDWFSELKREEESRIATMSARAQADLEQRKEALSLARKQLAEAEVREARAEEDLKQLTARDQMRRFIDERVTTQTYEKHLGIISMIRRDFEDLSDFMYRDRQPGEARLVKLITETVSKRIPTIERIILYIDDLDRCQPERVVEVLEAIHLLLAFRLFIVVVAVDPRWVIESLRRRYPHLSQRQLSSIVGAPPLPQGRTGAQANLEATAHDYLEKIFHIPFWVKPIGPEACRNLIEGFLGLPESGPESPEESERFPSLVRETSAQQSLITERPPLDPVDLSPDTTPQAESRYSRQTLERLASERVIARRQIENIGVTNSEEKFIDRLAPYLGNSPRRIKRYANTYRLLKSGLTRQEARLFAADDDLNDDYRIVLVFLAIVTGAPSLAPRVFAQAFALRDKFSIKTLIKEAGLVEESVAPIEAANAKGALELLSNLDVTHTKIEIWVPRVMRYAFRLTPVNLAAV